jgi:MFS family permease
MIREDVRSGRSSGALVPPLGRRAWQLLAGYALAQVGSGLIMPFLIIYLHQVRGLDLGTAGLVLATGSAAGFVSALTGGLGGLVDRFGAARIVVVGLMAGAAGATGLVVAPGRAGLFLSAALYGSSTITVRSGVATLVATLVPAPDRSAAFGLSYALINLGVGIGATVGGLILTIHTPSSFALVFLTAAVLFLLFALGLVLTGETHRAARSTDAVPSRGRMADPRPPAGVRATLADRGLVAAFSLNLVFMTFGFSQLSSTFPAWVTGPVGAPTSVVGIAFTANTCTIVVAQLFVLRLIQHRSRLRVTAAAGLTFALTWVVVLAAGVAHARALTTVGLIAALAIFGVGETLLAPSLLPLVNDRAPAALRGRYNALFYLSYPLGSIVGPPLSGVALARGLGGPWLLGLTVACVLGAAGAWKAEPLLAHPKEADVHLQCVKCR